MQSLDVLLREAEGHGVTCVLESWHGAGFEDLHSFAFIGNSGRIGTASDGLFSYVPAGPNKQIDMFLHAYNLRKEGRLEVRRDVLYSLQPSIPKSTSYRSLQYGVARHGSGAMVWYHHTHAVHVTWGNGPQDTRRRTEHAEQMLSTCSCLPTIWPGHGLMRCRNCKQRWSTHPSHMRM